MIITAVLFSNLLFKKKTTGESKEEKDLSLTSTSVNMTIKKEKVEIITLPQTEISSCRVKQIEPVKEKNKTKQSWAASDCWKMV